METAGMGGIDDSVTQHIANLRAGDGASSAHQFIFDRYFDRLARLTERRMSGQARRAVSGEDVASIALAEFFRQVGKDGKFPNLRDRDQLWPLLATIAQRRAINLYNHEKRKHIDGLLRGESIFGVAEDGEQLRLDQAVAAELTPESAEEILVQCGDILDHLKQYDVQFESRYYDVAVALLQGHSKAEIATKFGLGTKRTVERITQEIRILWKCQNGGLATLRIEGGGPTYEVAIAAEPVVIGRRRKDEPAPAWDRLMQIANETTRRIVITDDSRVSRNHCQIQVRNESEVLVKNISKKSELMVGDRKLLAGEDCAAFDSCTIRIPSHTVFVNLS